jgi:hypothetical protein
LKVEVGEGADMASFVYDVVLANATQEQAMNEIGINLVHSAYHGFNSTVCMLPSVSPPTNQIFSYSLLNFETQVYHMSGLSFLSPPPPSLFFFSLSLSSVKSVLPMVKLRVASHIR